MANLESRNGSKSRWHARDDTPKLLCWRLQLRISGSPQAVIAATTKIDKAQVSKNLQLLADFVADMAVGGMESDEFALKGVDI